MSIIFFIKSVTVNINNYTIKDIPGTSGRLDVISRCILAALIGNNYFDKAIQIWIFLDNYGTFIFDSEVLNYDFFPKSELLLTDYFVDLIRKNNSERLLENNPLGLVKSSQISIFEALEDFQGLGYQIFVLNEKGEDIFNYTNKITKERNTVFIVGNQSGDFINSKELLEMNLQSIRLGNQSYLASSVIRLIKLNFFARIQ